MVAAAAALGSAVGCGTVTAPSGGAASGAGDAATGSANVVGAAGNAGACQPGVVSTYVPATYQPATGVWQGVCVDDGQDLIGQYYDACFGDGATPAACTAFKTMSAATAACAACILTPVAASRLGPIIDYGGFVGKNTAGCIELVEPGGLPCATAVQALTGCELQACQANCPVSSSASLDAYYECAQAADGAGCASYAAMASCDQGLDGSPASVCDSAAFKDFYDAVVPLFCGQRATFDVDAATVYPPFTDAAMADASVLEAAADASDGSETFMATSDAGPGPGDAAYADAGAD
jgi:hypothetical protein